MGDADARRVHGQGMQLTSKGCSPTADGKSDAVGVKTDASGVVWSSEINREAFGEANVSGRQQLSLQIVLIFSPWNTYLLQFLQRTLRSSLLQEAQK